jgi:hypothetical protein
MKRKPLIVLLSLLAVMLAVFIFLTVNYKSAIYTASYESDTITFLLDYDTRSYQWWNVKYDPDLMSFVEDYTQKSPNASIMGVDMQHCFVFRANKPGTAFFTCELWYIKGGNPELYKTKSFSVITDPDGMISTYITSVD